MAPLVPVRYYHPMDDLAVLPAEARSGVLLSQAEDYAFGLMASIALVGGMQPPPFSPEHRLRAIAFRVLEAASPAIQSEICCWRIENDQLIRGYV
jgi:hypothetical protein